MNNFPALTHPESAVPAWPCRWRATIHHQSEDGFHAVLHLGIICKELEERIRLPKVNNISNFSGQEKTPSTRGRNTRNPVISNRTWPQHRREPYRGSSASWWTRWCHGPLMETAPIWRFVRGSRPVRQNAPSRPARRRDTHGQLENHAEKRMIRPFKK